jgi:hypothetical protein
MLNFIFFILAGIGFAMPTSAATIDFAGIANGAFTTYSEHGFTVAPSSGNWTASSGYGHPAPYIYFNNPTGGTTLTARKSP